MTTTDRSVTGSRGLCLDGLLTFPKVSGIYGIVRSTDGRIYVGSSKDIKLRAQSHLRCLRRGKHHCCYLQWAWDQDPSGFYLVVLSEIAPGPDMWAAEQIYLDAAKLDAAGVFNVCPIAGNCEGTVQSAETREKRAAKLRGTKRTPEQCARIRAAKKGKPLSEAGRLAITAVAQKRRFLLSEAAARVFCQRHTAGETWERLAASIPVGSKILRREIKAVLGNAARGAALKAATSPIKGSRHGMAILNEDKVSEIRRRNDLWKALAAEFGVTYACISDIKYRRSWMHVP